MDTFWQGLGALIPSIGVGLLFYVAIRAIVRADRNERAAVARFEAAERASAAEAANQSAGGAETQARPGGAAPAQSDQPQG